MGAKQSKRSVDISGKEAECGGEVAAAGGGAEGRVEALVDADALKPQVNGDAHIHGNTDKEKQLDSETPENEKDATTEKEEKEKQNGNEAEKEPAAAAPVTNGEPETKEGGDSAPTPEDGKKPKKEKVKKKWSLRSISFSRKDKPKHEKKQQKEEEPKINGSSEKVTEEATEAVPEPVKTEAVDETKIETEIKEEKSAETPVTEPLTNGSSTPESKAETPASEEAAPAPEPQPDPAPAPADPEPPALNGLSLDEPKAELAPETQTKESAPEKPEPTAETETETTPAPEIPVAKEVCVEKVSPESPPPPLPANPPPPSVVSFATSTMAPELTAGSLPNTVEVASAPHSIPSTDALLQDSNVCLPLEAPVDIVGHDNVFVGLSHTLKDSEDKFADIQTLGTPIPKRESTEETSKTLKETIDGELTETNSFTYNVYNMKVECVSYENAMQKSTELPNCFMADSVNEELLKGDIEKSNILNDIKQSEVDSEINRVGNEVKELINESEVVLENKDQSKIVTEITADEIKQFEDNSKEVIDIVPNAAENYQGEPDIISETLNESNVISDIVEDGVKKIISESKITTIVVENSVTESQDVNNLVSESMPNEGKQFEEVPEMVKSDGKLEYDLKTVSNEIISDMKKSESSLQSDTQDIFTIENDAKEKINLLTYDNLVPEIVLEDMKHSEPDVSTDSQDVSESIDDLPPPPPPLEEDVYACNQPDSNSDQVDYSVDIIPEPITDSDNLPVSMELKHNGSIEHIISVAEFKDKDLGQGAACNDDAMRNGQQSVVEDSAVAKLGDVLPAPPHAGHPAPQEPTAVSEKLAELIPEVPVIPDLNTETLTETTKDVAVNN